MTEKSAGVLCCPVCGADMKTAEKNLYCTGERKHCYDIASSGYINLLPPGKASNAKTGDDRRMLRARSAFLDTGAYEKFSSEAARLIKEQLDGAGIKNSAGSSKEKSAVFVDAGCGEGYHTLNIARCLAENGISPVPVGLEASKYGAEKAAKRAKAAGDIGKGAVFAAANIFAMPLKSGCADAVVSMFAPVPDAEAARVLKDGGFLIVCSSGSRHLWELRQVLYGEPRLSPPLSKVPEGFELCAVSSCSFRLELQSREEIGALFEMTPFFFRCPREGRERLMSLDCLSVGAEAEYKVYKKAYNSI